MKQNNPQEEKNGSSLRRKHITYIQLALLICLSLLTGCFAPSAKPETTQDIYPVTAQPSDAPTQNTFSEKKKSASSKKASSHKETLSVHFIDVGQGDASLITIGSHAMLIDAGDNSMGTTVWNYLKKQGITTLDYVIGTHPDSDHIGGLDVIIYKFDCKKILMPDCENDTATYRDVINSMKSKNYKAVHPKLHQKFTLGPASFTITGPVSTYPETNDNSISLRLTYQKTAFLFMGDVTTETEPDILSHNKELSSDVLKVAHHGSKYSTSEQFLSAVSPKYAVISCAKNNKYGFPTARVLNLLRSLDVRLYRTDEQGSLIAESDGTTIQWSTSPDNSWTAGESTDSASQQGITYILNTGTKKFHKPACRYTQTISAKNKADTARSKAELIADGYSPCGACKP